jgi:hypothetical protein
MMYAWREASMTPFYASRRLAQLQWGARLKAASP